MQHSTPASRLSRPGGGSAPGAQNRVRGTLRCPGHEQEKRSHRRLLRSEQRSFSLPGRRPQEGSSRQRFEQPGPPPSVHPSPIPSGRNSPAVEGCHVQTVEQRRHLERVLCALMCPLRCFSEWERVCKGHLLAADYPFFRKIRSSRANTGANCFSPNLRTNSSHLHRKR